MKKMLLALTLVAFTGACATDPYTGEERVARTAYGTGIGAAVGAGVGALVGGSKGAAWGAGIGAATGAAAGGYMDYQARELRKELTGTGVQISDNNGIISLIMPGNITFDTDVYTIKSSFKPVLDSIAKVINKYDQTNIQIVGHTDNVGSRDYNLQLSLKRATSVSTYLKLRDVAAARIGTYGAGPDMPIADNSTAAGREQNRRVEIQLINVSK
jgi:outer membrane protein OmpA-like peptidoglycan-associated protein